MQIPIVPTQRTNANIEKTKNSLKDSRLKHPKKVCLSMKLVCHILTLKVQSCKLYNKKYIIASTQIANAEIFIFIAVVVFKLLSR